ncbi:hypothetical protein DICVIV_07985 [Dictyocaulus viviparus]|uniref:Uncharacterized protein n=1 Tax=Dictyocaulus viviparus TaxID=29172 RepID=A0A0D8XQE8_DICVI|nr:hypothetical protein DICVIV_07985 [Dictyocaulus viviparus]
MDSFNQSIIVRTEFLDHTAPHYRMIDSCRSKPVMRRMYKRQATSVTSSGNAVVANNGTTTIAQNTTVASVVTTTATLNVSSEPTTTNDTSATEIAVIVSSETPVQTTTDGTDATVVAVVVSTVTSEQSTTDEAESTNASQETTTRSYVDEPITLKPNYVDEPHVPNKGKSSSAYNGNEQKGDQVSQSGQYGNIKVVPSGYRSKRASEYVDENITPLHGGEGDSYQPIGEENPAPIEQGYPDNEAPPVESNGYGDYDDNSGQTTRAVRRTTSIIRRTTTPVRRTTTPVIRTATPVIRTTRRIPSTTRRPQVTRTIPQRTTSRPYVTRPTTRNSNYADEPYVPEQGNSEGSYTGGEEEGQEVSQGENYGNPNVEPSGYRRKRASEYVDENITPSHGGEGDSYQPVGEENPTPIDQTYADNQAPPLEPAGY